MKRGDVPIPTCEYLLTWQISNMNLATQARDEDEDNVDVQEDAVETHEDEGGEQPAATEVIEDDDTSLPATTVAPPATEAAAQPEQVSGQRRKRGEESSEASSTDKSSCDTSSEQEQENNKSKSKVAPKKVTTPGTSNPLFANGGTRTFGKGVNKENNPKKTTTKPRRKNPRIELTDRLI